MTPEQLHILRYLLNYNADTGHFLWKVTRNSHGGEVYPGKIAGTVKDGYIQIGVDQKIYRAHRLAWAFMTEEMPARGFEIDHKNGKRSDNRWCNLRLVTRSKNTMNGVTRSDNKSGHRGVSFRRDINKWHARICVDGRIFILGNFASIEAAVAARSAGEILHFGEFSAMNRNIE